MVLDSIHSTREQAYVYEISLASSLCSFFCITTLKVHLANLSINELIGDGELKAERLKDRETQSGR